MHAIIKSKLDYGVHLEADSVVNWNVDILFDVVHRWLYALRLATHHPGYYIASILIHGSKDAIKISIHPLLCEHRILQY